MSNDTAIAPHTVRAHRNSDTAPVWITAPGYDQRKTARVYKYLVVRFSTLTQKWSQAKQDYVPCRPQIVIVKGTDRLDTARAAQRKFDGAVVLGQQADGRTWVSV